MGISTSVRKQLFATTILVAAGSIYGGYGRRATAGTCATTDIPPAHLNISCSGATNPADVTQSFTSAGGFTIVDVAGFGLDTSATGGNGLETDGGTTDITITGDIHAQGIGIDANVTTAGATTEITNSGSITSDTRRGIYVYADNGTGNVTITNEVGATIQASREGIGAYVDGEDAITTITNSGSITSNFREGIYVYAGGYTDNVTITNEATGVIQADDQGIKAFVNGEDAITTITNSGSITSDTREGIYVRAGVYTGNVTITNEATGVIQADIQGIRAFVNGEDAITTITNSGSITSDFREGIYVYAGGYTDNVTITNEVGATIQAADQGIEAFVYGTDAITTITNSGSITSDDQGIYVSTDNNTGNVTITNEATGVIQADDEGIDARVYGVDAITTITNSGSITSDTLEGILVGTDGDTGNVTITNEVGATIQADHQGIEAFVYGTDAITTITNSGSITSDTREGIRVSTDGDTGNVTITNEVGATIQADIKGIEAFVNGEDAITTISNSGEIISDDYRGIEVYAANDTGNVTITNAATGTIQAEDDGIYAYVNNSATTTITTSGTITSETGNGIRFYSYSPAQTATVNININETITASAGAGVYLNTSYNDSDLTATVNIDADINADTGVTIAIADVSEVAVNIKSDASVIGTSMGIEDGASNSGGISAQTTVILEGELGGNVDLGGNDDSFTMKGADASLTAATTLIDGGDGVDAFNFDNAQMPSGSTFTPAIMNFETIELKNGSFVRVNDVAWDVDDVIINSGNTLEALGASNIMADLANNGTVSLADGAVDEVFTIDGNLSGSGTFVLDAILGAAQTSDQVVVTGNVDAASAHVLTINNLGGDGIDTGVGDTVGILVVDVSGTVTASNFSLANGSTSGGAYSYSLHLSAGNDFYLQTTGLSNAASVIPSAVQGSTLGADALMTGYNTRLSSRIEAPINPEQSDSDGNSFGADILHASDANPANKYWLRLLGAHGEYDGRVSAGRFNEDIETDADFGGIQLGVDFAIPYYPDTYATLWGHYLYQSNDVYNHTRNTKAGEATIRSGGVGLGITYDPGSGMYFDALGSISFSQAEINVSSGSNDNTRGTEYLASAEIGYRYQTGYGNLSFIPQAQISTHIADFASYTDDSGLRISDPESRRSTLRLGLSAEDAYQMSNGVLKLIGTVSWSDVFSSKTQADFAATQVDLSDADEFIEGNLGMEYKMDDNSSVWANVNYKSGLGELDSENTSFALGFSIKF